MRWPRHPNVIPGESLSSWLRRIASVYGLKIRDLLRLSLECQGLQRNQLDMRPPEELIAAISLRTGLKQESIRKTTLTGMLPFLFEYSDGERFLRGGLSEGIPWFRKNEKEQVTACRLCLEDYPEAALLLPWRLTIILSCPIHGLMLEPAKIVSNSVTWLRKSAEAAPTVVRSLDSRSWTAVTEGQVLLPGGEIDTSVWFCFLKTMHHEMRKPMRDFGKRGEWQQLVWDYCPQIFCQRKTQTDPARRWAILIATAFDMMEKGDLRQIEPGAYVLTASARHSQVLEAKRPSRIESELKQWTSR
ncbi:MAG: hypothetical protein C0469_17790 [Cyanobacteria bacterium DS2.3.42]|nr:hypothetical protein [Cyanobacteria bacterium DS2.3.42]